MLKKIGLILLIAFIVIQFIHPAKNKAAGVQPNSVTNVFPMPDSVTTILKKACYDCHSNNTNYPWYSYIQPVHWWLDNHIKEGKEHLNFDDYSGRRLRYQFHKMEEVVEMVKEGEMPLNSYTWGHGDAKLSEAEKQTLVNWANHNMEQMKAKYPLDSLVRPRN